MSRWFRNKILNTIKDAGLTIAHVAGKTYQLGKTAALFATEYPVASATGAVAFAILAYTASSAPSYFAQTIGRAILSTSPYTIAKLGATALISAGVRKAWILVFTDPELQKAPGFRKAIINETASDPPFLQQVTSPDGVINTIYRIAPVPSPSVLLYGSGWSMETPAAQAGGDGIRVARDVQQLKENFRQGYIRDELPPEMQRYIRNKLKLNTSPKSRRHGGANSPVADEKYTKDIDQSYLVQRLPEEYVADPVVLRKEANEDGFKCWIPMTSQQSAALQANFLVDTPDPGSEVSTTPSESLLPEVVPATVVGHTMTKDEVLEKARETGTPAPPVLPSDNAASFASSASSATMYPYNVSRRRSKLRRSSRRKSSQSRRKLSKRSLRSRSRSQSRSRRRKTQRKRTKSRSRTRTRVRFGSYR